MSPARAVVRHCLPTRYDLLSLALALLAMCVALAGLAYGGPPQCTLPARTKQCTLPPRVVVKAAAPSAKPSKIGRKQIKSFCPCSPQCDCGCNEGLPCKCGATSKLKPTSMRTLYRRGDTGSSVSVEGLSGAALPMPVQPYTYAGVYSSPAVYTGPVVYSQLMSVNGGPACCTPAPMACGNACGAPCGTPGLSAGPLPYPLSQARGATFAPSYRPAPMLARPMPMMGGPGPMPGGMAPRGMMGGMARGGAGGGVCRT